MRTCEGASSRMWSALPLPRTPVCSTRCASAAHPARAFAPAGSLRPSTRRPPAAARPSCRVAAVPTDRAPARGEAGGGEGGEGAGGGEGGSERVAQTRLLKVARVVDAIAHPRQRHAPRHAPCHTLWQAHACCSTRVRSSIKCQYAVRGFGSSSSLGAALFRADAGAAAAAAAPLPVEPAQALRASVAASSAALCGSAAGASTSSSSAGSAPSLGGMARTWDATSKSRCRQVR